MVKGDRLSLYGTASRGPKASTERTRWRPGGAAKPAPTTRSNARPGATEPRQARSAPTAKPRPQVQRPAPSATSGVNGLVVGVGDLKVASGKGVISTHGLGSCIAVCMHDPVRKVAGMLHFMLPDSRADARRAKNQPAMFGDIGIPLMLNELRKLGGNIHGMKCQLIGGAQVPGAPDVFNIGNRNILMARRTLWQAKIRVAAEDVAGTISRTVHMNVTTGELRIIRGGRR